MQASLDRFVKNPFVLFATGFAATTAVKFFGGNAMTLVGNVTLVGGLILFILGAIFYLLPTVIASARGAGHQGMIIFINLVFGWTVLGWIAALIWAIVEKPAEENKPEPT